MDKRIVTIKKKLNDFKCLVCYRIIDVSRAEPQIIETDNQVIHSWNYRHAHKRVFEVFEDTQIPIEDSIEYD